MKVSPPFPLVLLAGCGPQCTAHPPLAALVPQGERALAVFEELRRCSCAAPDLRSFNLAIKGCESPPTRALRPQQARRGLGFEGGRAASSCLQHALRCWQQQQLWA